jgi:DNA-binding response OmpR family regulator
MPRLHGFEVGAADYCLKPIRSRDLREGVRSILEASAARAATANGDGETAVLR